ncbi:MAG: hypothetical protein ABW099_12250 [Candidatus Binatia bacterium]
MHEAKRFRADVLTKSGFMLGVGETSEEVMATLRDLREQEVDIVTIGQYLQPSNRQLKVERYVTPVEFLDSNQQRRNSAFATSSRVRSCAAPITLGAMSRRRPGV